MTLRRTISAAVVALALALPGAAQAQDPPEGDDAPMLQGAPPAESDAPSASPRLPATGAEPGILALTGAGLLMMGFGLRLRLPGA